MCRNKLLSFDNLYFPLDDVNVEIWVLKATVWKLQLSSTVLSDDSISLWTTRYLVDNQKQLPDCPCDKNPIFLIWTLILVDVRNDFFLIMYIHDLLFSVKISLFLTFQACIHQKDYLNFRYHHKRALYCAYLVKHLRKDKLIQEIQYALANGDSLKPIVVVKLADKAAKKVSVRLHPCLPVDEFKESRFLPSKSNIRKQWYTGGDGEGRCGFIFQGIYCIQFSLVDPLEFVHSCSLQVGVKGC